MCPSVGFEHASDQHWLFTNFVTKIARNSKFHIGVAIVCQNRLGMTPPYRAEILIISHAILVYLFLFLHSNVTLANFDTDKDVRFTLKGSKINIKIILCQ